MSIAPENWWLHCPHCDRWARAVDHGVLRIKARSKGKRILGRCSQCHKLRWIRVVDQPPGWQPPSGPAS
ncbi:MAG: hypothetical protein JNK12_04360 [Acidimicrobiales bacterium]|nr:hypothetical protein [Acidimicrobiales bacterium]